MGTPLRDLHSRPDRTCWLLSLGSGLGGGCREAGGGGAEWVDVGGGGGWGPTAALLVSPVPDLGFSKCNSSPLSRPLALF